MEPNRLTRQDSFRVAGWLTGKLAEIKEHKLSQTAAAAQCSKDLGIAISNQTIAAIFHDMGQDTWPKTSSSRTVPTQKTDRVRLLARNMLVLHKAICQLANVDAAPEFDYASISAIANGRAAKEGNQ